MAEAAWRARFCQRVVYADDCFRDGAAALVVAEAILVAPIQEAAAQDPGALETAVRNSLQSSLVCLREAAEYLNTAVVNVQAARILALQGSSADPAVPLASIEQAADPVVRSAMARLQTAPAAALDAYEAIEWSRGHLATDVALLDGVGIPNAGGAIVRERRLACRALRRAMERLLEALNDVAAARQILTGP